VSLYPHEALNAKVNLEGPNPLAWTNNSLVLILKFNERSLYLYAAKFKVILNLPLWLGTSKLGVAYPSHLK